MPGQMCLAGYGLGTTASVNPLADTVQLAARLLLEDPWRIEAAVNRESQGKNGIVRHANTN